MARYVDIDDDEICYCGNMGEYENYNIPCDYEFEDVRPVVHGHWYIREYEYFTCSECGHDEWNGCDSTADANQRLANGETPNFCSHCGSDMR